jgi:hypothetical protein
MIVFYGTLPFHGQLTTYNLFDVHCMESIIGSKFYDGI